MQTTTIVFLLVFHFMHFIHVYTSHIIACFQLYIYIYILDYVEPADDGP